MANNRIFYACHAAGIAGDGETSFTPVHGLQSVGITTAFNLTQVFEIGQISIYENIEDIPDVQCTMEKVLDGYPLIYHLATRNSTSASLVGRSADRCIVAMSIFSDVQDSASGTPLTELNMSGMYVSNLTYTIPVDGNSTESLTLVGNNKVWKSGAFTFSGTLFDNTDEPLALTSGLGGVQRREDVIFSDLTGTLLPGGTNGIPDISSSGTNDLLADGSRSCHVQGITISTNLNREPLFELGRKTPFFRFASFPVEVTCDIEVLSKAGDLIGATEDGVLGGGSNLSEKTIRVKLRDSTYFDLGTHNNLSNVTQGGADAGGGNMTVTYSYLTYNDLTVTQDQDPAGL